MHVQHLVIGSGAGGALTAALLAEAGKEVLLLEEGSRFSNDVRHPFSIERMASQYRNGGMTVAAGRPPIAYSEGCCVGGTTEINAGLYREASEETLAQWGSSFLIRDLSAETLEPHYVQIAADLSVQPLPGPAPRASQVLAEGAASVGWTATEVPRMYTYGPEGAVKQAMTRTYLPRASAAGALVASGTRAERLVFNGSQVVGVKTPFGLARADHIWLCAGAIGTAALLRRSGIRLNIGNTLQLHPVVRLVSRFDESMQGDDVPVHQVQPPDRNATLGGLLSTPSRIALALTDDWANNASAAEDWAQCAVYYATISAEGHGYVRSMPHGAERLVSFRLTKRDKARLGLNLADLARLMFAAGACCVYPGVRGGGTIDRPRDAHRIAASVAEGAASVLSFHLFSTTPMGEDTRRSAVDSFGRVRRVTNLRVNDAAMLPASPGVNPQATVMAIARRNVIAFLRDD